MEICCDSCPFTPTCEEENELMMDTELAEQWWEAGEDG